MVLNRTDKVLFIEQKNGALQETGLGLAKHYADADKDIAHQLQRFINKVREKLAVCPNCSRALHHAHDKEWLREYI